MGVGAGAQSSPRSGDDGNALIWGEEIQCASAAICFYSFRRGRLKAQSGASGNNAVS